MLTTFAIASVVLLTSSQAESAKPSAPAQEVAAPAPVPTPLDRFKALKGTWDADMDGDGKNDTAVEYRVIAGGSVVAETLFPGTEHEMITMYHMNGKELMCTHYCAAQNQPRLTATTISKDSVAFTFKDATNLPDLKGMHMNAVTFTFAADGTMQSHWTSVEDGKPGHSADFRMKRCA